MRLQLLTALTLGLAAMAPAKASAGEKVVVDNVLGPEGPLFVDGNLYFVSWNPGSLSRWDGHKVTVLNNIAGCGHNGLALTNHKTLLVACTDPHGAILEVDMNGKQLSRWDADDHGNAFTGGINDLVVAANGGAYATVFGPAGDTPTAIVGKVLYKAPGSDVWVDVADDINYANGIGVSPDQKTLYVSAMADHAILKFSIEKDGTLSHRSNFVQLDVLVPNKVANGWAGPDSFKVDSHGALYVAQFYNGRILKISPQGKLLHIFDIAAGNGTTNVAFGPDEADLFVTVVTNAADVFGEAKGKIVEIPNVR